MNISNKKILNNFKKIRTALILLILAAPYLIYEKFFADKIALNKIISNGIEFVECENIQGIKGLLSNEFKDKDELLNKARNFFKEYELLKIKISKKSIKIDNKIAESTLYLLITSNLEGLGKVTGTQNANIEFKKDKIRAYRGWRIKDVNYDY